MTKYNTISLSKIDKQRKYTSKRQFIKVYLLLSTFFLLQHFCWQNANFKMTVNVVS